MKRKNVEGAGALEVSDLWVFARDKRYGLCTA